jgi:hypothetical protein
MKIGDRVRYQGRTGKVTAFMPGNMVDVRFEGASYDERKAKNLLEVVKGDVAKKNGGRLRPPRRVRRNPASPFNVTNEVETGLTKWIGISRQSPESPAVPPEAKTGPSYDLNSISITPLDLEAYRNQLERIVNRVAGKVGDIKDEIVAAFVSRLPVDETRAKEELEQEIHRLGKLVIARAGPTRFLMQAYESKDPGRIERAQQDYATEFPSWDARGVTRPDPVLLEHIYLKGYYARQVLDNLVKAYQYEALNVIKDQTTFEAAFSRLIAFVTQIRQFFGCSDQTTEDCLRDWYDFSSSLRSKFALATSSEIPGASGPLAALTESRKRRGKPAREQKVQKVSYFKKKETVSREPKSALDELLRTAGGGFFTRHDPFRPANWDEVLPPGWSQMSPEEQVSSVDEKMLNDYRPEACGNPIDGTAYYMTLGSQPYKMARYITWFDATRDEHGPAGKTRRIHSGVVNQTQDGDFLIGVDIPVRYQFLTSNPLDARKKRWPQEVIEFEAALYPAADLSSGEMVAKIDEALSPSQEEKVKTEIKEIVQVTVGIIRAAQSKGLVVSKAAWNELLREQNARQAQAQIVEQQTGSRPDGSFLKDIHVRAVERLLERQENNQRTTEAALQDLPIPLSVLNDLLTYTVQVGSDKNATVLRWVRPTVDKKTVEKEIEKINKEIPVSAYHRVKLTSYYHAFTQLNEDSLVRAEKVLRNLYELRRVSRFFCAGETKPKELKKDFEALRKALKDHPEIWAEVQAYVAKSKEVAAQIEKTKIKPHPTAITANILDLLSLYNPALRLEQSLLSLGIQDAKGAFAPTVLAIDSFAQMCGNMFLASVTNIDEIFEEMNEKALTRQGTSPNDLNKKVPYIEKITQEQLDTLMSTMLEPGETKVYPVTQLSARVDPSGVGKATGADPAEHFYVVDNLGRNVFFRAEREYNPAFEFVDAMNPYAFRAFRAPAAGPALEMVYEASVRDGNPISRDVLLKFFNNGMVTGTLSRGVKIETFVLEANTDIDPRMIIRMYARHKAYNPFFTWQLVQGPEAVIQSGPPAEATAENYVPCVSKADANRIRGYRATSDLIYQYREVFSYIRSVLNKVMTEDYYNLPASTGSEDQLDEVVRKYIRAGEYALNLQQRWREEAQTGRYTDLRLAGKDLTGFMRVIIGQLPKLIEESGFGLFQTSRDPLRKPKEKERLETVRKKRRPRIRTADKPEKDDDIFQGLQDQYKPYVQHVLEQIVTDVDVDMTVWDREEDEGRIAYNRKKAVSWPTLAKTALNFFARAAGQYAQDDVQKTEINTYLYGQYRKALQEDLYNPIAGALPFVAPSFDKNNLIPALKEDPRYVKAVQQEFDKRQTAVELPTCPVSVVVQKRIGHIPSARESSRNTVLFLVRDSDVDVKLEDGRPYLPLIIEYFKNLGYTLAAPEQGPEREEPRRLPGRDPEVGGRDEFRFNAGYIRRLGFDVKPMNPRDINTAGKNEIVHYLKPYALIIDTGNFLHRDIVEAADAYGVAVERLTDNEMRPPNLNDRQQRQRIDLIIRSLLERQKFESEIGRPLSEMVETAQHLVERLLDQAYVQGDTSFTPEQREALLEMSRNPDRIRDALYTLGDFRVPDPTGGRLKDLLTQFVDAIRSRRSAKSRLKLEAEAAEEIYMYVSALMRPETEELDRKHPGSADLTKSLLAGDTETPAAREANRLFNLLAQMGQGNSQTFDKFTIKPTPTVDGQTIPFTFLPRDGVSEETFAKMDEIEVMSSLIERGLIAWRDAKTEDKTEVALRWFRFLWLAQFYYYLNGYKAAGPIVQRGSQFQYPVRDIRTLKLEYERSKKNKFMLDLVLSDIKKRTAEVYLGKNLLNRVDRLNAYALRYLSEKEERYQKARQQGRGFKPLTPDDKEELSRLLSENFDFTEAFLRVLLRRERLVLTPEEQQEVSEKMKTRMLEVTGQRGGRYLVEQAAQDISTILGELRLNADSDFLTQPIGVNELVEGAKLLGDNVTPQQMRVLMGARQRQEAVPGFGRTGKILVFKTYNPILFEITRNFYGDIRSGQRNLMRSARLVDAIDNAGCYGSLLKISAESAAYTSLIKYAGFGVEQAEVFRSQVLGRANFTKSWQYPSFAYAILRNEKWDGAERRTGGRKAKAEFGEYSNIGAIWPLGESPETLGEYLTELFYAYDEQGNGYDREIADTALTFMRNQFEKDLIFVEGLETAYFRPDDELKFKIITLRKYLESYKGNYLSANVPYLDVAQAGGPDVEYRNRLREITLSMSPKVAGTDKTLDLFEAAAVARWYMASRREDPVKWKRYQRENATILKRLSRLAKALEEADSAQQQQDLLFERTNLEAQLPAPYSPKVIKVMWDFLKEARTVASPGRLPPLFGDVKKTQQALYETSVWRMIPAQMEYYAGRREELASLRDDLEKLIDPSERAELMAKAAEARLSAEEARALDRDRLLKIHGQQLDTLDMPLEVEVYNNPRSDRRARTVRNPFRGRQYR